MFTLKSEIIPYRTTVFQPFKVHMHLTILVAKVFTLCIH